MPGMMPLHCANVSCNYDMPAVIRAVTVQCLSFNIDKDTVCQERRATCS